MTTEELEKIVARHECIETACALHGGLGFPTRRKKRPYAGKE